MYADCLALFAEVPTLIITRFAEAWVLKIIPTFIQAHYLCFATSASHTGIKNNTRDFSVCMLIVLSNLQEYATFIFTRFAEVRVLKIIPVK